jgi:hypothetical protein
MRLLKLSFQDEAKWMVILSVGPLVLALLLITVVWLLRMLR